MENAKIVEQNILENKKKQNYVFQIGHQLVSSINIPSKPNHV